MHNEIYVVIADWHIGDESIKQNIPNSIVANFFQKINQRIELTKAKELTIVINGDFWEFLTSDKWNGVKIWDNTQDVQDVAEKIIEDIFETDAAKIFQTGIKTLCPIIRVKIHYIIGNHDRLVNDIPAIQEKIVEFFGMKKHENFFFQKFYWGNYGDNKSFFATHGHEYEFGKTWTKEDSNGGLFGDKMQICVSIRAMIEIGDMIGKHSDIIYTGEVAPKDRRKFVTKTLKNNRIDKRKAKMVTKIMRKCVENFIQSDLVKQRVEDWAKSLRDNRALIKITQGIFCNRIASMFWSRFLFVLGYFVKSSARNKKQKEMAARNLQNVQDEKLECVIFGHTHHYENSKFRKTSINGKGRDVRYINLGGWISYNPKTFSFDKECRVVFLSNNGENGNSLEIVKIFE